TRNLSGLTEAPLKVGVWAAGSTSAAAQAAPIVTAEFDYFTITPDDTAVLPGRDDTFDGTELHPCRWQVINEDGNLLRVQDGLLRVETTVAAIYGAGGRIPNVIVQDQPNGDWTMQTLVDTSDFDRQYQNAGLIVYVDEENYMKWDIVT